MYGVDHTLNLTNHPEGGLLVALDLPYRETDTLMNNGEKVHGNQWSPELV